MVEQGQASSPGQSGQYPLCNSVFNLISLIHNKSEAIGAYQSYEKDAANQPEVLQALRQMRSDDEKTVKCLAEKLRCELNKAYEGGSGNGNGNGCEGSVIVAALPAEELIAKAEVLKDDQLTDEDEAIEGVKKSMEAVQQTAG